ncbi:tRNA G18 (ribose-2'-O)-methylase SpoU [Nocardiopsis sp. Huas11]|uniref:TrmH family RNA methyltransferase n=1 Tax=Nocardiopsis sp. Huas11 TaxID=2183912 RepID=UPI000EB2874F|nr:RNA methyltransferase [Nocardiopsis sp. Huas11]RKS10244.1 tRNA G18 (ribose-2'-O)-methylase SpoU [Nocardiopsis sp. Huas11]
MDVIRVSDPADPRLADYTRLRDVNLRRHLEAEHGLFMAEGDKVIRRAAAAGFEPRSFLLTERRAAALDDVVAASSAPLYVVSEETAERLVGFDLHRGALAAYRRRALPPLPEVLAGARSIVVLEDLVDHTNVGAIFRSAAGLGVDAVVLAPRCADPLYRRAVKVSMGAVFTLPYTRLDDWYGGLDTLREAGFHLMALTPGADSVPLRQAMAGLAPDDRVGLLLGTEGDGLSSRWLARASAKVHIPMARDIDSLNVTAAAAVACYELAGRSG